MGDSRSGDILLVSFNNCEGVFVSACADSMRQGGKRERGRENEKERDGRSGIRDTENVRGIIWILTPPPPPKKKKKNKKKKKQKKHTLD